MCIQQSGELTYVILKITFLPLNNVKCGDLYPTRYSLKVEEYNLNLLRWLVKLPLQQY